MRQQTVIRPKAASPTGVLHSASADAARSRHVRYHPAADLEQYVEHYWSVEWDYRGVDPERVEILPHPSVHMTFDRPSGSRIMGIVRGKFSRLLEGRGAVFGVKFTPGGFQPFLRAPVSSITDTSVTLVDVFADDGVALARAMRAKRSDASRITVVEEFLRRHIPEPDDNVARVTEMVYAVAKDRSIVKVEDLAARLGTSRRTMERLFAKYVGVSPKWVIQRYRLHEAAQQLASGAVKQAALALSLGYTDQAHFIHDFKTMVGKSPAAYAKSAGARRSSDPPS